MKTKKTRVNQSIILFLSSSIVVNMSTAPLLGGANNNEPNSEPTTINHPQPLLNNRESPSYQTRVIILAILLHFFGLGVSIFVVIEHYGFRFMYFKCVMNVLVPLLYVFYKVRTIYALFANSFYNTYPTLFAVFCDGAINAVFAYVQPRRIFVISVCIGWFFTPLLVFYYQQILSALIWVISCLIRIIIWLGTGFIQFVAWVFKFVTSGFANVRGTEHEGQGSTNPEVELTGSQMGQDQP